MVVEELTAKNNSKGDGLLHIPLKLQLFPLAKNAIHMRIENIFDTFDVHPPKAPTHTIYVQVKKLAEDLYKAVNGDDAKLNSINIIETTLTGNQEYSTMKKNKIQWVGEDDATITEPEYPKDKPNFEVALQPQRIRAFSIEFIPFTTTVQEQMTEGFMSWIVWSILTNFLISDLL